MKSVLVAGVLVVALVAGGCASAYVSRGVVLGVDPAGATVTLSHDAIPGYMDAMAMPFSVRDRDALESLQPGDRIRFRLIVRKDRSYLDRIEVVSAAPADTGLLDSPAASTLVPVGGEMPDFELRNQAGARMTLSSLRGQVVAVTFIYTRCPLPEYCPRMVENFRAVRDRFRERLGRDLTLLTITFDPKYDSEEVLRDYARAYRAQGAGWHFLTGSVQEIERVCGAFGVAFWPEEGLITHTLQTAVIDRQGRLAATVEGKDYTGRQLGDLIEAVLKN